MIAETFSISYKSKSRPEQSRRAAFRNMKDAVLGSRYELSLVFITKADALKLNKIYRKKEYVPNVLSFPLSAHLGEIFICPDTASKEASLFGRTSKDHIAALFIHGLYHLKGYKHGSTMERAEQNTREKFNIHGLK